jgi:hypothetical protein
MNVTPWEDVTVYKASPPSSGQLGLNPPRSPGPVSWGEPGEGLPPRRVSKVMSRLSSRPRRKNQGALGGFFLGLTEWEKTEVKGDAPNHMSPASAE